TETNVNFFPDALSRQGILTNCDGSEIQRIEVRAEIRPYLDLYPLPDSGCRGGGIGEKAGPQFQPTNENFLTGRLDHKISDRDSLFVRYTFDDATSRSGENNFLWSRLSESRQQYATLVASHIFDLRRLIAFRLGYTRPTENSDDVELLEIPRSLYFVSDAPHFGQISIPSMTPLGSFPGQPSVNVTNTFQFSADAIAQSGPHSFRLGAEVHRYRWDSDSNFMRSGRWAFNSFESFLQGGPQGTNLQVALPGGNNGRKFRQTLMGMYLQDQYSVTPRLQLSLGLRYEFATVVREKDGEEIFLPDPLHDSAIQIGQMLQRNPSLWSLAPRLGWRWAPFSGRSTVLQGGIGLYYDQIIGYTVVGRKNTQPFWNTVTNPNFDATTTFPNAVAGAAAPGALPPHAHIMDYFNMKTPRVLRYNFSIEQPLSDQWDLQASYVGARGTHLFRRYEFNMFPAPVSLADGSLFFPDNCTERLRLGLQPSSNCRPGAGPLNPAFGTVALLASDANSFYNSMQLSLNGRLGRGVSLQARYTYSKSVDDDSNAPGDTNSQYGWNRTLERALSDFDIRHRWAMNYFWNPPFGAGQRWLNSGLLSAVLGGWRLGGIVSYRTGVPSTLEVNVRTPGYLFAPGRPNLVAGYRNNPTEGVTEGCLGVPAGKKLGTPELYYDPCAFSIPAPGTLGNLGRNTVIAPSVFNADVSLQKEFSIDAQKRLQFRAELFNLLNHPNFGRNQGNTAVVFSGSSGRRSSSAGRLSQSATTARQLQFALRFSF
ncbi:MAG: TonB-dependent receptor domain-containing protein, partial [Terriglobia bacterium]